MYPITTVQYTCNNNITTTSLKLDPLYLKENLDLQCFLFDVCTFYLVFIFTTYCTHERVICGIIHGFYKRQVTVLQENINVLLYCHFQNKSYHKLHTNYFPTNFVKCSCHKMTSGAHQHVIDRLQQFLCLFLTNAVLFFSSAAPIQGSLQRIIGLHLTLFLASSSVTPTPCPSLVHLYESYTFHDCDHDNFSVSANFS